MSADTRSSRWWVVALLAWAIVVGGAPLLLGPPGGDDAYYHAMRAHQHARCLRAGVVLPRWYPDLNGGLGGPEPRAYPLVPLIAHGVLALATGDAVTATSAATVLIVVLAALAMLVAARRRGASPPAALLLGGAWAAAPFLVATVHERVALAEGWALALLPLALDALLPPAPADGRAVARAGLFVGVLLACQLPVALMAVLLAGLAHALAGPRARPLAALSAGGLGLGLAAVSWLPNLVAVARLEGSSLTAGGYAWSAHLFPFGAMADLVLAGHLRGISVATAVAALLLAALARGAARRAAIVACVAVTAATPLLAWLYRGVPGLEFLQFPWRWLGPAGCLVLLAAAGCERRFVRIAAVAVLALPLARPIGWRWRLPDGPPLATAAGWPAAGEAARRYGVPPVLPSLPAYLPRGASLAEALVNGRPLRDRIGPGDPTGPVRWGFEIERIAGGEQLLPLLAGPGWEVAIDGRPAAWQPSRSLVGVVVPAGRHRIEARQRWLAEDAVGAAISLLSVAGAGWWLVRRRREVA